MPVKTSRLSEPAVVAEENAVYFAEREPLTSSVEFGDVVPMPICAIVVMPERTLNNNGISFFIVNWIWNLRFVVYV